MLNLFIAGHAAPMNKRSPAAAWDYLREKIKRDVSKVNEYIELSPLIINNNHLFVTLLSRMLTPLEYDDDTYVEVSKNKLTDITRSIGITSIHSHGKPHKNCFVGNKVPEYFLLNNGYTEYRAPVEIIYHARTDIYPIIFDGNTEIDNGFFVFLINSRALINAFKTYRLEQLSAEDVSIKEFIKNVIITGLIPSYIDIACYNKHIYYLKNKTRSPSDIDKLPMFINDFNKTLDSLIEKSWKGRAVYSGFTDYLANMPVVFNGTALEALRIPNIGMLRTTKWLIYVAMIGYINDLLKIADIRALRHDKPMINTLFRDLKYITSNKSIQNNTDDITTQYWLDTLSTIRGFNQ